MKKMIGIFVILAGCSHPSDQTTSVDGSLSDAVVAMDAGIDSDTGVDAGVDAQSTVDLGVDAGFDLGAVDSGSTVDAGVDSSVAVDAGPMEWIGNCDPSDPVQNTIVMNSGDPKGLNSRNIDWRYAGFNLDGLNNAAPPNGSGATVAGCSQVDYADTPVGGDNAFRRMIETSGTSSAFGMLMYGLFQYSHNLGSASSIGHAYLEVKVTHASSPATTGWNDSCVGVIVRTYTDDHVVTETRMQGAIVSNAIVLDSSTPVDFELPVTDQLVMNLMTLGACTGSCVPSSIHFRVHYPKFLIGLTGNATAPMNFRMGGAVFNEYTPPDPTNAYGPLVAAGGQFGADINALVSRMNMLPQATPFATQAAVYQDTWMNYQGYYQNTQCSAGMPPDAYSFQLQMR